jgi:hypothetical protein
MDTVPVIIFAVIAFIPAADNFRLRKRLKNYEEADGSPKTVSTGTSTSRCIQCNGFLNHAVMDDDWGPRLSIASTQKIRADGSLVFDEWPLLPAEEIRLDSFRGVGHGFWCENCRQFWV